jgi:hypothetical protein
MVVMRHTGILLVAAGYALSFLVVCLGTCFAAAPVAEHACCDGKDGFRAAAVDCCFVTPGASPDGPILADAGLPAVSPLQADVVIGSPTNPHPASAVAASPPLILRI